MIVDPFEAPSKSEQTEARDAVFTFSFETYADALRREMMRPPDRILTTLLNADWVDKLLVADPWRSRVTAPIRSLVDKKGGFPDPERQVLRSPHRFRRRDQSSVPGAARDYRRYDRDLMRASRALGQHEPIVITTNPLAAGFSPFLWAGPITYFGRDDWTSYDARRAYWPAFQKAYEQIARSEIGVVAVSEQIISRINPRGPSAVVANGVDPAEWLGPQPEAPGWLGKLPAPRAVYVGTIDSRFDADGLCRLSEVHPGVSFVLVGPWYDSERVKQLSARPNITVKRNVRRAELVALLRNCDVALVSHLRSRLTEAMSPLKVYEYLAAGLPVLSIDLPPVRNLGDRVILTDDVASFSDVFGDALAMGPEDEQSRTQYVTDNSWAARHKVIQEVALR